MEDLQNLYEQTTLRMLAQFQFIEQSLKYYISIAYEFIELRLDGAIHFGYSSKDLDSLSLERLLTIFCKLNANTKVVTRLNKLKTQRNHIAHKALTVAMGRYADIKALRSGLDSYDSLQPELSACIDELREEIRTLGNKFGAAQQQKSDALDRRMRLEKSGAP
ncbi:hypothetical protein ASG75_06875 [Rhodanobacter sp. Soil772]|uniref:hypothetical protein n=1 Tax=Rhodanobacter sp. Soil772 TaxID=1736406 RepID=UPI0006F6F2F2|nr:hypothetical protein [Rhodanobacter sp. Soil772]KRE85314.1 hypothetical protein ASG75_06875 [Rhodanobacter sp. Soil772]